MGNMTSQERLGYAMRQLRMYDKIIRYGVLEQTFRILDLLQIVVLLMFKTMIIS